MQQGTIVFTKMDRVIFGQNAAEAVLAEADRLDAKRVFILSSGTLARETPEVDTLRTALGNRFAGLNDYMPSHSPRDAVVACANQAREAGTDLLVTIGGGSVTDGGKAVTICRAHGERRATDSAMNSGSMNNSPGIDGTQSQSTVPAMASHRRTHRLARCAPPSSCTTRNALRMACCTREAGSVGIYSKTLVGDDSSSVRITWDELTTVRGKIPK